MPNQATPSQALLNSLLTESTTPSVALPDVAAAEAAANRQTQLIKPLGSLGQLEHLAIWFAARFGKAVPSYLYPGIAVFAADHGIAQQGVSAYPASVTVEMLNALALGQAAIAVLAKHLCARFRVIDVGVNVPAQRSLPSELIVRRIAPGTRDLSQQPAMTLQQVHTALWVGAEQADALIKDDCNLLIAGEVGIGNTTAAACVIAACTGELPEHIVGRGTGINDATYLRKLALVEQALQRAQPSNALHTLAEFGGFEIAAMCGFYLRAAERSIPVVLDGFIATAAALCAQAIAPNVREWLLASHVSAETGHAIALRHLQLQPLFDLGLRLGEGSGAALAVPLLQLALQLHRDMATFAQAGVSDASEPLLP